MLMTVSIFKGHLQQPLTHRWKKQSLELCLAQNLAPGLQVRDSQSWPSLGMCNPGTQVREANEWGWGFLGCGPGSGPSLGPSFHHGCIPSEINKGSVGAK